MKTKATAPKATPFFLHPSNQTSGFYGLRVVRSGKTPAGDHYYVSHDGVATRLATEQEIKAWHKVIEAEMKFERLLHQTGGESRYVGSGKL